MNNSSFYTDISAFSADYPSHTCSCDMPRAGLPFRIPRRFASRFPDSNNPVIRQFIPTADEALSLPYESGDPLGESGHEVLPFLVHQYPSRVLIRTTEQCAAYCRFCFRRNMQTNGRGFLSDAQIQAICEYVRPRTTIREILISGGDPLFAPDSRVFALIEALRKTSPAAIMRLCTRMPIIDPKRITEDFLRQLQTFNPLVFVIHTNHPHELDTEAKSALQLIAGFGFRMFSQTVLLRSINDTADTLAELFRTLYMLGVNPYYLFQGDLAKGTAHFRVPLSKGIELYRSLRTTLSGTEIPRYAVDAPHGGGKVYVMEDAERVSDREWKLRLPNGTISVYPEE